jgi:hypothetical protein
LADVPNAVLMSFIWVVAVEVLLHCPKATSKVSEVPIWVNR